MRRLLAALVPLAAGLAAAISAHAGVGFQMLSIPDPQGPPIEVGVWYPTEAAARPTRVGPFEDALAPGAPVSGRHLPLIVMSHGNGGYFGGHHDTALALAQAGFVAAALTHTGDNYQDQSKATQIWERPRQLKVLTDYMLSAWRDHAAIDPERIGAFGFSAGGFTVLTAAGGEPDLAKVVPHCQTHPDFYDCRLMQRAHAVVPTTPIAWVHDPRIKSVVAAAPAIGFTFGPQGLSQVRQPVQLWRAADDQVLPYPYYAEAVRLALPTPPETHVVPHAGHYDFLAPCPPAMAQRNPEICTSEPGFDRAAFHAEFDREVVAFFKRTLEEPARGAPVSPSPAPGRSRPR